MVKIELTWEESKLVEFVLRDFAKSRRPSAQEAGKIGRRIEMSRHGGDI